MAQIVCLANSVKHGSGRCVAGVNIRTGRWIRPIGTGKEGAIGSERLINGNEPQLLDVLDIPIGGRANDLGCQPENVQLLRGKWSKVGILSVKEVSQYLENTQLLLHNNCRYVWLKDFKNIPSSSWKSLQLISANKAHFFCDSYEGKKKRKCSFQYNHKDYTLPVTCPNFDRYVDSRLSCYLTVSLGGPIPLRDSGLKCWKMVAGIIPL